MNVIFPANPVLTFHEHTRSHAVRPGHRRRARSGFIVRRHDTRYTPVD